MSQKQSTSQELEIIGKSVAGPKHKEQDKECQDNWDKVSTTDYIIVAVGDGLGSADRSSKGSEIATKSAVQTLSQQLEGSQETPDSLNKDVVEEMCINALFDARKSIYSAAEKTEQSVDDYHTTLSIGLGTTSWYAGIAIGDSGLVGIEKENDYFPLVEREDSEHANKTTPLTADSEFVRERLRFRYDETSLRAIVAFTDGLDRFAWSQEDNSIPRKEFFDQIYKFVTEIDVLEEKEAQSDFEQFVDSDHFHKHSGDDKTLVVGRLPEPPESDVEESSLSRKYTNEAFVKAVKTSDSPSTATIKEEIECAYSTARRRLERLEEEQVLKSTKTGGERIWQVENWND